MTFMKILLWGGRLACPCCSFRAGETPAPRIMFHGKLLAIAIARQAKGTMENVESIEAVAGEGLMGDRYGAASAQRSSRAAASRRMR